MDAGVHHTDLVTFKFGDGPQLADRLAALVVAGVKTGTCSAAIYGPDTQVGERQICLNSSDIPVCEIETVKIQTLRFDEVTPEMAASEGEGDLSYRFWRDAHIAFFEREGTWSPDMEIIFETFRVVKVLDADFAKNAHIAVELERAEAYQNGYTALGAPT